MVVVGFAGVGMGCNVTPTFRPRSWRALPTPAPKIVSTIGFTFEKSTCAIPTVCSTATVNVQINTRNKKIFARNLVNTDWFIAFVKPVNILFPLPILEAHSDTHPNWCTQAGIPHVGGSRVCGYHIGCTTLYVARGFGGHGDGVCTLVYNGHNLASFCTSLKDYTRHSTGWCHASHGNTSRVDCSTRCQRWRCSRQWC